MLWGSNARNAHPIFFHHLLRGVHNGARLYAVDPRRTASAQWADVWLGLDVGSDIALANGVGREILAAGLENRAFIEHATINIELYEKTVEPYTLERTEQITGVPQAAIQELAHRFAEADRAQICWTLGITEHHTGVDNVLSLINLALLTGHVGRYGSGLNPLRGQNNVQGGGDMGAIPNKLPGFKDIEDDAERSRFEQAWGLPLPKEHGWHLSQMFEAMDRGELRAAYIMGENPAESEADVAHCRKLLDGLDHLVVQDIFLTKTAEYADVVFPAAADWCEADGTVTNSERRVQRTRKAIDPPGQAWADGKIIAALAKRMGHDWGEPTSEQAWDELRSLSAMHAGMSYSRLEELGGIQWPCWDEDHPGSALLHERLWKDPLEGAPAPFHACEWLPPIDTLTAEFPLRMTTVRRLDAYNTGVQTDGYTSPLWERESLRMAPEDAAQLGLDDGQRVLISSRRGAIEAPLLVDPSLRPGLTWMTPHATGEADVNLLTNESWDPKSGTSEFKAAAIRVDPLTAEKDRG